MQKQFEKMLGKRVMMRTHHREEYIPQKTTFQFIFYHNINIKKSVFFFRAWAEKGIAWHIDASSVVETLIYHRKLANQNARSPAIVVKLAYRYTVMTVDPGSVVWDNVLLSNLFMCKLALINK